jgi:hypothetical protein
MLEFAQRFCVAGAGSLKPKDERDIFCWVIHAAASGHRNGLKPVSDLFGLGTQRGF